MWKKGILPGILIISFLSCGKYEDGPFMSILTVESRIENTWIWNFYLEDDQNRTGEFADKTLEFTADQVVNLCDTEGNCETGSWSLISKKQNLQIIFGTTATSYNIRRLESKEMWLEYLSADSLTEIQWQLVVEE